MGLIGNREVMYTFAVASPSPDPRVQKLAEMLETAVRAKHFSLRELERRLGVSSGTARRLFDGVIELKLRHVLDILEILDIEPALFFRIAYETTNRSNLEDAARLLETARKVALPAVELEIDDKPVPDEKLVLLVEAALERLGVTPAKARSKAASKRVSRSSELPVAPSSPKTSRPRRKR
jgi:transcriptional regulator with XRE-family HTH domain